MATIDLNKTCPYCLRGKYIKDVEDEDLYSRKCLSCGETWEPDDTTLSQHPCPKCGIHYDRDCFCETDEDNNPIGSFIGEECLTCGHRWRWEAMGTFKANNGKEYQYTESGGNAQRSHEGCGFFVSNACPECKCGYVYPSKDKGKKKKAIPRTKDKTETTQTKADAKREKATRILSEPSYTVYAKDRVVHLLKDVMMLSGNLSTEEARMFGQLLDKSEREISDRFLYLIHEELNDGQVE